MGNYLKKIRVLMMVILIILSGFPKYTYAQNHSKVLFITSYSSYTTNFGDIISGIKEGLGEDTSLHIKYLDYNYLEHTSDKYKYYKDIKLTVKNGNYDAVIVGDYYILKFALENRDNIFHSIPIVFFGALNKEIINKAIQYEKVTGIKVNEPIGPTIDLILDFHPNVDNIILINNFENSEEIETFKNEIIPKYKNISFETIFTSKITEQELKNKLRNLDDNYAIITMYANDFKDNQWISNKNVNSLITSALKNTPLYNLEEGGIGNGSIGGKIISFYNYGEKAGQLAQEMIEGKELQKLYLLDDAINQYIFDFNVMRKYGIKMSDLPEKSEVINSPIEFIKEYKSIFVFLILFVILLILTIILLIIHLNYKRKYEDTLHTAMSNIESLNKLKNHFIINMSHELKTPITVINSVMQLTKNKRSNYDSYLITRKNIKLVEVNCQRLLKLINNLIDLEKVDSQDIHIILENVNIVEVIEDTVLSVVPYAKAKNIDIIFDTVEEEIIMAVDKNKIERIVLNLLSNAIKYSKDIGIVEVNIDIYKNNIVLTVEDNGVGIEEKNIDKIFDRFVRLDDSLTRKNEGTGIGLSIVKAFVECHNGSIKVDSEKNIGTKFIINIPIVIKEEEDNNRGINTNSNIKQELSDIYL